MKDLAIGAQNGGGKGLRERELGLELTGMRPPDGLAG